MKVEITLILDSGKRLTLTQEEMDELKQALDLRRDVEHPGPAEPFNPWVDPWTTSPTCTIDPLNPDPITVSTTSTRGETNDPAKDRSHRDGVTPARKLIQEWVNKKVERLNRSIRLTETQPTALLPELDSQEAYRLLWGSILDLKNTLEFAEGVIFTKDAPLQLPSCLAQKVAKLKTANEITVSSRSKGQGD